MVSIAYVLKNLINNMGILIIIAYMLSKMKIFKDLVTEKKNKISDKIIMSVIFGFIGILATYMGTSVQGAIANSRIISVLVGGIFGGPVVGIGAGVIAGFHRWSIDIGGFTSIACMISTIAEGFIGGIASKYMKNTKNNWLHAFIIGMFAEILQMIIILLVAKPFDVAVQLVKIIWIPMVLFNPIGISVFVGLIDGIYKEQEKEAAIQTQLALNIAEKSLPYLRKGLSSTSDIKKVAEIILKMSEASAVAITNTQKILVHVGIGEDHHKDNLPMHTQLTRTVLETGNLMVAQSKNEIGCTEEVCKLKAAVIVPLLKKDEIIGTIKIYKTRENSITDVDIRLAVGLAKLFSTQLELADIEYEVKLREKAELRALQSQINPHFLFNALNTIVSFCRIKPERARELLIDLSTYFRNTLVHNQEFVDLNTELKHVNAYLSIEKARFDERLRFETDIGEEVDCMLPQLILQPLVENAVIHGLLPKKEGGSIKITARKLEKDTIITVEDTGVGIQPDIIEKLYNNKLSENKIGLSNVNNRLKNIYGTDYGLKISRGKESGTIIQMKIPDRRIGEAV